MKITLNGSPHNCPDNINATDFLAALEMQDQRIALEINKEIVTRSDYDSHRLNEGDIVEVIQAIGGG